VRVARQTGLQYQNAIRGSEDAMRRWLGGIAALLLCAGTAATAGPADCGTTPDVKCLAATVFALATTLPASNSIRQQVAFAEQELAPGDIVTALEYIVTDYPDPPPWDSIDWLAKAGRLDVAIKQARQLKSPAERVGALLAVAASLADRKDATRAQKVVEEAEHQLPSVPADELKYVQYFGSERGELWLRLGQTERALRSFTSTEELLRFADKYPGAAAKLRAQAWHKAERDNKWSDWKYLAEDAVKRGDQADAARAGERASNLGSGGEADAAIALARALAMAGLPDLASKLIKPWPQWLNGSDATHPWTVGSLMPVLAALGQDQDVLSAARAVSSIVERSRYLGAAGDEYVRLGRIDAAERLDAEALALVSVPPADDPKLQSDRDAVLNNLALARAGRGDIQGAFVVVAKLRDEAKVRQVMSYVVLRAIDSDHTPVVGPAIEALQEMAIAAQDAGLLLQAAERWYTVGSENKARGSLARAMKMIDAGQAKLTGADSGLAAELTWRLEASARPEALIDIVDRIGVTDAGAIDHLVEIVKPVSPAVAMQLTARQSEVERRIDELAKIALQIARNGKP
jgi:tetratricopeptide (TPR) repeat protein